MLVEEHRVQLGPVSPWPTRVVLVLVGVAIGWMLATWLGDKNSEPAAASVATVCDGRTNIHLDLGGVGTGQLEVRLPLREEGPLIPVTTGGFPSTSAARTVTNGSFLRLGGFDSRWNLATRSRMRRCRSRSGPGPKSG